MAKPGDEFLSVPARAEKLPPDFPLLGLNAVLGDFWSWAYSDILSNTIRPMFAEFLVARALGITEDPRVEWDAVDLRYRNKRLEVKSTAYLQSWPQRELSNIRFDIAKRLSFHADTGRSEREPIRSADCYVFCLYGETAPEGRNARAVLDVTNWSFYVASSAEVEASFGAQKSIRLAALAVFGPCDFPQLRPRIEEKLELR